MPDYLIPNLLNACRVLQFLADEPAPGASVAGIARELHIPRTTALRIVTTCCQGGLLRESGGLYTLGAGLIPLGMKALEGVDLRRGAQPLLRRLAEATDETAHLAMPVENRALLVEVCQSPHPIRVGSPAGTLADLNCSSTGKVFLAYLFRERLEELFRQLKPRPRTPRTLTTAKAMAQEVERILALGYALDDEEYCEGIRCLAAPVRDNEGCVVAAVGITGPSSRFTRERIKPCAEKVLATAQELSRSLGFREQGAL